LGPIYPPWTDLIHHVFWMNEAMVHLIWYAACVCFNTHSCIFLLVQLTRWIRERRMHTPKPHSPAPSLVKEKEQRKEAREMCHCHLSSMDSDLEAFSRNPTGGSLAPLAVRPRARTKYPNQWFLSY